jgi:hypothetical protein
VNRHKGNNILSRIVVMVTKDGYPQHTTLVSIPLTDVYLDPKLDLRWTNRAC